MIKVFQFCDFCGEPILYDQLYGTLVYNVESIHTTPDGSHDEIRVDNSEQVHIMCLQCGERYNREQIEDEIKQIGNQGIKKTEDTDSEKEEPDHPL